MDSFILLFFMFSMCQSQKFTSGCKDALLDKSISFPSHAELDTVGQGFARLSARPTFQKVEGAIEDSHIRIKTPALDGKDYISVLNGSISHAGNL